jgi:hypothetical protein
MGLFKTGLTEVQMKTKASRELALEALSSAIERELKILTAKLEEFKKEIEKWESKYKMSSKDFYEKFERGELGDDEEYFSWWAAVQAYNSISARVETLKELHAQCRQ